MGRRLCAVIMVLLYSFGAIQPAAEEHSSAAESVAERARKAYVEARKVHFADKGNLDNAWRFGRACFEWAEFSTTKKQRASLAEEGIAASRRVVGGSPRLAAGHYYLALNLGQLARTQKLGALPLVAELKEALVKARSLDAKLDNAGPDRCLGMLFRDAPGWPISVGSKKKSRVHLINAVTVKQTYPGNHLELLAAAIEWDDEELLKARLPETAKIMQRAREEYSGVEWEGKWAKWENRWRSIRKTAAEDFSIR